jgi:hypothetical protein
LQATLFSQQLIVIAAGSACLLTAKYTPEYCYIHTQQITDDIACCLNTHQDDQPHLDHDGRSSGHSATRSIQALCSYP